MGSVSTLQALQGFLKITSERQQMIATNMANADTPGYQTRDIDFQSAMRQVMDSGDGPRLEPATLEVADLPERPDGNNVNIDRESLMLSHTQLQYQMGVQLVKSEFHTLYTAMKD
jgi:flagellar basal-body rod protein FlgB